MTAQEEFNSKYVTCSELSEQYNISVFMLSYLRKEGRLCDAVKVGNCYVFPRSGDIFNKLEAYIKNKRVRGI